MQEQELIKVALEIAHLVDRLPEQYRVDAFRVLLEHQLGIRPTGVKTETPEFHVIAEEISFSEFLNKVGELKTNPQRFAGVAYYYDRYRKESSVTKDNIVDTMMGAGLHAPANFGRDMQTATSTKNALLMQAREPKNGATAWQLTITGRKFVEEKLKT